MTGASRANVGHWPIRVCWAHGTRGAIRRVADDLRWALLTEIGPAVDTSTARLHRQSSEDSLLASPSYDLIPPLLNRSRNDRARSAPPAHPANTSPNPRRMSLAYRTTLRVDGPRANGLLRRRVIAR